MSVENIVEEFGKEFGEEIKKEIGETSQKDVLDYLNGHEKTQVWENYKVEDPTSEQYKQFNRFVQILSTKNLGEEQLKKITTAYFNPLVQELANTYENNAFHNESSVLGHTMDVFEYVVENSSETDLDLYVAALFHDVGKIVTMEEKNGQTRSIKHDKRGEEILGANQGELENICDNPDRVTYLVGAHMEPLNLYNSKNESKNPEKTINKALNKWGEYKEDILKLSEADICKSEKYEAIKDFYDNDLRKRD